MIIDPTVVLKFANYAIIIRPTLDPRLLYYSATREATVTRAANQLSPFEPCVRALFGPIQVLAGRVNSS